MATQQREKQREKPQEERIVVRSEDIVKLQEKFDGVMSAVEHMRRDSEKQEKRWMKELETAQEEGKKLREWIEAELGGPNGEKSKGDSRKKNKEIEKEAVRSFRGRFWNGTKNIARSTRNQLPQDKRDVKEFVLGTGFGVVLCGMTPVGGWVR